jgi:putative transcriptional regulator
MSEARNTFATDLLEAAEEMVAIEKGEAAPARSHRYVGDVLVEVREGDRVVWSLRDTTISPEVAASAEPKAIREALHQTQEGFASLLHVSVGTLRGWEQGRRTPRGPAETLLQLAAVDPGVFLKLHSALAKETNASRKGYVTVRTKSRKTAQRERRGA